MLLTNLAAALAQLKTGTLYRRQDKHTQSFCWNTFAVNAIMIVTGRQGVGAQFQCATLYSKCRVKRVKGKHYTETVALVELCIIDNRVN